MEPNVEQRLRDDEDGHEVLGMLQITDKTELRAKRVEKFLHDKPCTLTGE